MNNTITRIFVVYLLIVWKITSCGLFCICCLLALFEKDTAVSWIVKNNCPLFILCVANDCRGLYCIPSSVVSFSCQHLFLTEPMQTLIIPAALLWTHSSPWDGRVITSQNTQGAGTQISYREKKIMFPVLFSVPFFVISIIWCVCLTWALEHLVDILIKFSVPMKRSFPWVIVAVREAIILYIKFSCVNHLIFNTFLTLGFVPNTPDLCYQ